MLYSDSFDQTEPPSTSTSSPPTTSSSPVSLSSTSSPQSAPSPAPTPGPPSPDPAPPSARPAFLMKPAFPELLRSSRWIIILCRLCVLLDYFYWKYNPSYPSVGWSICLSVGHSVLKGRKVTLQCSYIGALFCYAFRRLKGSASQLNKLVLKDSPHI